METIKGIGFENFRVFAERSDFELAPVTILTGGNSSGKSTIIKGLKLLQRYWDNPDGQSSLLFDGGTHQLGDYEMALSNDSDSEELIVRYYQEHILFGKITVENVFELDESNRMKNGALKSSAILRDANGSIKELYKTYKEGNRIYFRTNADEIINTLIPELKELYEEQKAYREKVRKYFKRVPNKTSRNNGEIEDFGDYQGPAMYNEYDDYMAHPVLNREFCDFLGIDHERCKALDEFGGIIYDSVGLGFNSYGKVDRITPAHAEGYDPDAYKIGANSKLLELIARVPADQYRDLEKILWKKIVEKYPEVTNRFNEASFLNLIDGGGQNIVAEDPEDSRYGINPYPKAISFEQLKSFLKEQVKESFDQFYRELENKVLSEQGDYAEPVYNEIPDRFMNGNTREMKKLHLNKGLHSNSNKLKHFGGYSPQEQPSTELVTQLFNCIGGLEKELFGSFDGSSLPITLVQKIKGELDVITYQSIQDFSKNTRFIESVRANPQRLYTHSSQGTPFNSLLAGYMRKHKEDGRNQFLNKWVKNFEIGDSVEFQIKEGIGTEVFILKSGERTNLVDMGYGVTQLLPLLMEVSDASRGETFVIEEPETNLHPKLQSKLADMFIDACKTFQVRFIVETHSEYLIRKLQYLTAKGGISTGETIIHYIDNKDPKKRSSVTDPQVRTIRVEKDGALSRPFGAGFYDEADNLAMELWSFN